MTGYSFNPDFVARALEAMAKPAPLRALALIASGRVVVEVERDGQGVLIDELDGHRVRDDEHPDDKMGLAGSWPLLATGMIDEFGTVTPAGREALATARAHQQKEPGA